MENPDPNQISPLFPDKHFPDPTEEDLKDPLFEVIWQVIKKWDISPTCNGLYSGATGTDVMRILVPLREALKGVK